MPDEKEPQVRVVDRRWWAQTDQTDDRPAVGLKPTYVEELERQIAEQARQLQAFAADHRRALDEFEQARGRIRRDVAREVERGKRAILADLLEVLDNLDRAVAAARDERLEGAAAALLRGVDLVRDQFLARLEALGVSRIPALGQPFDAAAHEAVTTAPVDDASRDGTVVAVLKEGYTIGGDLLRPASVVVGDLVV
ncbi:MAG: nucleotide exchange factor GrpE [Betaproteobacteria bacterium]